MKNIKNKSQWSPKKGPLSRSKFDFAVECNEKFALIEYHGKQHYYPVSFGSKNKESLFMKNLERDTKKELFCKKYSLSILIIPFWEYNRIDEILDEFFAGKIPTILETTDEMVIKHKKIREKIIEKYTK